jgi:hypothetical protein
VDQELTADAVDYLCDRELLIGSYKPRLVPVNLTNALPIACFLQLDPKLTYIFQGRATRKYSLLTLSLNEFKAALVKLSR